MTQYPDETIDRLTTRLKIIQKRRGHRAASDDMLLAWAAARAQPEARSVLVIGCRIYKNFGTPQETSEYVTLLLSEPGQKQ